MWQAAYSELVFVPIHWPDFDKAALEGAIAEYATASGVWRPCRQDRREDRVVSGVAPTRK
jgi:hypothetical protein